MARLSNWTDRKLTCVFLGYKRRYWGERIRRGYSIYFDPSKAPLVSTGSRDGSVGPLKGVCHKEQGWIVIWRNSHRTETDLRETILHEMAHAVARGVHGRDFYREIKRIRKLGAPVSVWDCLGSLGKTVHKPVPWLKRRN